MHTFEPYPRVRTQLEGNLALNNLTNVTVHPFGLGIENKTLPFYAAPDSNLGAASFKVGHKRDNYYLGEMQVRRGDDVMAEMGIGKVGIIKADVEGYGKIRARRITPGRCCATGRCSSSNCRRRRGKRWAAPRLSPPCSRPATISIISPPATSIPAVTGSHPSIIA